MGAVKSTWFLGPTGILSGISIGSAGLQGSLLCHTDRPRTQPTLVYWVCDNRPHLRT